MNAAFSKFLIVLQFKISTKVLAQPSRLYQRNLCRLNIYVNRTAR